MSDTTANVKQLLRAQAAAILVQAAAQAGALNALADTLDESHTRSDLLTVGDQTRDQYHAGRESLMGAAERGEITLVRGARRRVMVERSELERWIKSRKVTPGPRRAPAADLDAWEHDADRVLHLVGERQ